MKSTLQTIGQARANTLASRHNCEPLTLRGSCYLWLSQATRNRSDQTAEHENHRQLEEKMQNELEIIHRNGESPGS